AVVWFIHKNLRKGLRNLTEDVHLLFTGTAQKVETLESFASFGPLIEEINRLNSKLNQELKAQVGGMPLEAGFLHELFQQVFLLEERPMMAVNRDNQIIAISEALHAVIPLSENFMDSHVTEGVNDTHLQGELMSLLNELSMGSEILDRSLSLADRVVHVRGMPVYLRGDYIASVLIF